MRKSRHSILALLFVLALCLQVFASCDEIEEISTDSSTPIEQTTENTVSTETEAVTETKAETDASNSSETVKNETEALTETETEEPIRLESEHGDLILLSDTLANGPQTFYSGSSVITQNNNASLEYRMQGVGGDKMVKSLSDRKGNTYISDTMDVFVRMTDGSTHYTASSLHDAELNIYRYGYYFYENRIEGQSFVSEVSRSAEGRINHLTYENTNNITEPQREKGGFLSFTALGNDPWVSFQSVSFSTEKYDYLEITLKVSNDSAAVSSAQIFVIAGSHTFFTANQSKAFSIIDDGEYHTYQIPLSDIENYTGAVRGLRFDVNGGVGTNVSISSIKMFKADYGSAPADLTLQRSFLTYSDKLHHILQVSANKATEGIKEFGMTTRVSADRVNAIVIKDRDGLKSTLDGIDWKTAEYVGFDIKNVGVFGYILPYDNKSGGLEVTFEDGYYCIVQTKAVKGGILSPSEKGTQNANDFFMGQRIYTDSNHTFDAFINAAEDERHPLTAKSFVIDQTVSDSASFAGYNALRGYYQLNLGGTDFNQAYYNHPNKHFTLKFSVKSDDHDRQIYLMTHTSSGSLETAALLDSKDMLLPIPLEVAKNFCGDGENTIYNLDDAAYGEVYFPMLADAEEAHEYTILNLYQNWGQFPLKQISSIQFFAPYYHLSTGVTETNCIVPLPSTGPGLPDHRAMSAPFWKSQPQHNSGGSHNFLRYTDENGLYAGSNNTHASIDSYGPTYCDLTLDFIGSDKRISATYTHTEMPQTDENRAYYEMKYTVLEDITFKDFASDFVFYAVTDNNSKGTYKKVGYLDENNVCRVAEACKSASEDIRYVLGDECPYFSFFDMPDYDQNSTSAEGYTNLSFLIYNAEFVIGGEKADPSFMLINSQNYLRLSLDLKEVTLKAGDTFTINAILMPWGSQESDYSGEEPDFNVREVRRNTLLNPLKATANADCEVIESVFVPKLRTTNGKNAEFTLSGGHNNVAVRVYGFDMLTAPVIEEFVDGAWVPHIVSSNETPDAYGIGHYYDGYMVHYDGDGTYSYSFIATMENGAPRTFRISADTQFEGWPEEAPEVEKEPDPINVYLDPSEILQKTIGSTLIGRAQLGDNASYIRLYGKNGVAEGYMSIFSSSDPESAKIASTGQYFVYKYRMPSNVECSLSSFEYFTSTVNSGAVNGDNMVLQRIERDDEWHVVIIDISKKLSKFQPNENGEYLAKYFRFDIFNGKVSSDLYIDFAYMGFSDSLEDILALNLDMKNVLLVNGNDNLIIDPKTGKEYVEPPKAYIDPESGYTKATVGYYAVVDMINGMGGSAPNYAGVVASHAKSVLEVKHNNTTIAGTKLVFSGWAVANGGIAKYVWSADGGKTWHNVESYNGGTAGAAGQAHLDIFKRTLDGEALAAGSNANSVFQGSPGSGEKVTGLAADLSDYAGQKVNVTFGAIPKAEPTSICVILHVLNVSVLSE